MTFLAHPYLPKKSLKVHAFFKAILRLKIGKNLKKKKSFSAAHFVSIHVYFVFPHLFSTTCGKRHPLFKVVRSLKSERLLPQAIFYLFKLEYEMYGKS